MGDSISISRKQLELSMFKYWDVKFEDYYQKVKGPVLFLPSEEEWANEQI